MTSGSGTRRRRSADTCVGLCVQANLRLVARRPDPEDGRRQLFFVTDSGHAFPEDRRSVGEGRLTRAPEDQCTEAERHTLLTAMALLDRIVRS
ncbi:MULTISPECIES: hypothetical protein [unclassified Streptomyces]|uniref:hypothetical protein n=1 Tax=unclassified Streptomyces TaxID=2593676 RepID=UPI0037FC0468